MHNALRVQIPDREKEEKEREKKENKEREKRDRSVSEKLKIIFKNPQHFFQKSVG